ncbi:hypothetical protein [uncultured Gemmiger sp.]|uniref:hypothetical protein n=1 Tax=uncultured Gemmiger sp. TaxID=1623490 RepID=UPI0025FA3021|nr:hypothetical protein [uncultured Gemmiger sp.]
MQKSPAEVPFPGQNSRFCPSAAGKKLNKTSGCQRKGITTGRSPGKKKRTKITGGDLFLRRYFLSETFSKDFVAAYFFYL